MPRFDSMQPIRLRIHPFAPAGLFLLLSSADRIYVFALISCVLLHELGHLVMLRLFGKRPSYIRIMPAGIAIGIPAAFSYTEEILVAAAGPVMNILYLGVSSFFPTLLAPTIKNVSLLLFIINILPIGDLDGGRILCATLSFLFNESVARRVSQIACACALSFLWVLSLYIFFYSGINMSLLIFCAYLFSYLILKKACHEEKNVLK